MDRQRRQDGPVAPEPEPQRRQPPPKRPKAEPERHPELVARLGDEGDDVSEIAGLLRHLGYATGGGTAFDEDTEAAVRCFERDYGLTPSGEVVDLSLGVMREAAARLPVASSEVDDHDPIEQHLVDAAAAVDIDGLHRAWSGEQSGEWARAKPNLARAARVLGSMAFSEGDGCSLSDAGAVLMLQDTLGIDPTGQLDQETLALAATWAAQGDAADPAVVQAERANRALARLVDADAIAREYAETPEPAGWAEQKRTVSEHLRSLFGSPLSEGPVLTREDVLLISRLQVRTGIPVTGRLDSVTLDEASPRAPDVLPDPAQHTLRSEERRQGIPAEDQGALVTKEATRGTLFSGEPRPDDVRQGAAGDCWFLAALASLANQEPATIRSMVAPNDDGTYSVRLHRKDTAGDGPRLVPVTIRVDGDLYTRNGEELYAKAPRGEDGRRILWVAIVEKALVQFESQYGRTGEESKAPDATASYDNVFGAAPHGAMEVITGRAARWERLHQDADPVATWRMLKEALDAKAAVVLASGGEDDPEPPAPPAFMRDRAPRVAPGPDRSAPDYLERLKSHVQSVVEAEAQTHALSRGAMTPEQRAEYTRYQKDWITFRERWEHLGAQMPRYKAAHDRGIILHHAHTVLGVFQVGDRRYVELRNPHGRSEPSGGGADDGRYVLEINEFVRAAQGVSIGGAPRR